MDHREKEILRAAIRELQMENDDKLLIGKLHHHILTLQMNEASNLRTLEKLKEKCLRLETANVQLEKALDDRENSLFKLRIDGKMRARLLQNTLSDLRSKLAGSSSFEKYEKACNLIHSLDQQRVIMKAEMQQTMEEKTKLKDKLSNAELKLKQQDELVATLKDMSTSSRRVAEWHSKISKLQLENLALHRDLMRSREACETTSRELAVNLTRSTQLEEELVSTQVRCTYL
jgi:centrosomal protein CEP290